MLSIFAPHFFNWTEQLKDSGHEVYWLDVLDSNTPVEQIDFVEQISGWRYKWDFPGRYFLKEKAPHITQLINIFNERSFSKQLEKQIKRINPHVVHSFVLYLTGIPALSIMKKFPTIKWVYSSWGSDMYYYQQQPEHLFSMKKTLSHIHFMFSDCRRDYRIAKENGFTGKFLGVIPGGGGFKLDDFLPYRKNCVDRNIILIKGYQGLHGKCITVLKSIENVAKELKDYRIVIFGAPREVFDYVNNSSFNHLENLEVFEKVEKAKLIELMGQSLIYIGNSSSDGMPNTLLEAIIMEVFPIQSNPGGATAEIIVHGENGLLIEEPENVHLIADLLLQALTSPELRKKAVKSNSENITPKLERERLKKEVLEKYTFIENEKVLPLNKNCF